MTVSSDTPSESTLSGAAPPPTPDRAERPASPVWPALTGAGAEVCAWLMRPRVRLTLTGVLLLLVGGLIAPNTVWTLPLVIIGALMVAVAWIGHRLEGRFAVEWGEAGTQLAFNTTIKAPHPAADAPALGAASSARPTPTAAAELTRTLDDVIEGEAHTVEINVSELKALIAAAEAAEAAESVAPIRDVGEAAAAPGPPPAAAGARRPTPAPRAPPLPPLMCATSGSAGWPTRGHRRPARRADPRPSLPQPRQLVRDPDRSPASIARTARRWRASAAGPTGPAGSSTTNAVVPGSRWFDQLGALPGKKPRHVAARPESCWA